MNLRNFIILISCLIQTGCYNRYKSPLYWDNTPYPYIQSGFVQYPCKFNKTITIEILDRRKEFSGKKVGTTKFKSEFVLDNELSNLSPFLTNRFCTYFHNLGIACAGEVVAGDPEGKLQIFAKTITPDIRGALWGRAHGIVELGATLVSHNDTLFSKNYIAVAEDGDADVPIGKYSVGTIEFAGKLVTATSIKRISDSIIVDLCRCHLNFGSKKKSEI